LKPVLTVRQPEAGSTKAWFADDAPSVNTVSVAPPTVGSPTSGWLLSGSFACPTIFRSVGLVATGFFT
jgi:hypothetical protein